MDFGLRISDIASRPQRRDRRGRAPARSRSASRNARRRRAFTLVEMLATVAVLIIVLGLMVSLARNVRDQSAIQLTRDLLRQLELLVNEYSLQNDRQLPHVTPIIPDNGMPPEEPGLALLAKRNNEDLVRALRPWLARLDRSSAGDAEGSLLGQLPLSVYDGATLRDAWGSPIVFMPTQHPSIGMAPKLREDRTYFFFSAGPDRKYLSRDDNLYSYETVTE